MKARFMFRMLCWSFGFLLLGLCVWGQETSLMPTEDPESVGWHKAGVTQETPAILDWQPSAGRTGGGCLHILASDMGVKNVAWKRKIAAPPGAEALTFLMWVRGKEIRGGAFMMAVGLRTDPSKSAVSATTFDPALLMGDFEWTSVRMTLVLQPDVHEVWVNLFLIQSGEVWFDGLTMQPVERPKNFLEAGPGLIHVQGSHRVEALRPTGNPKIVFPLPLSYGVQVPLTFRLWAEPACALLRSRVREDSPGNWVCEAEIAGIEPDHPVRLRWSSMVLCAPDPSRTHSTTMRFPKHWPKQTRPWLKSTYCVESADSRFVAIAGDILSKRSDLLGVIREAHDQSATIGKGGLGPAKDQRSTTVLTKASVCTGDANRLAAILRACSIPARLISGYVAGGSPQQTHYLVEVYLPVEGWILVDTLLGAGLGHSFDLIQVSAVPLEHEERALDRCPNNAGGVPYLSLPESPGCDGSFQFIGDLSPSGSAGHSATPWRRFPADAPSAEWELALRKSRRAWEKWLKSADRWQEGNRLETPLDDGQLAHVALKEIPRIVR